MNILIYCPNGETREAISRHLIDLGNYQLLFAETVQLAASVPLYNEIKLLLLFDPARTRLLIELKDYVKQKRPKLRIRILPSTENKLMEGWRDVINKALRPTKPRLRSRKRTHPRFQWKPGA